MILYHGTNTNFSIKFDEANEEWAEFIINNRNRSETQFIHDYDIVIGPVADDGVAYILNRYLEGSFTIKEVAKELEYMHLNRQYCFCSQRSLQFLRRIENG